MREGFTARCAVELVGIISILRPATPLKYIGKRDKRSNQQDNKIDKICKNGALDSSIAVGVRYTIPMTGWENQYIQLVTTKPDFIVAERDRESPERSKAAIEAVKGNYKGVFVEIGSGSGMHLLRLAEQNPEMLCVGLEIRFKRAYKTGEKAEKLGLPNVLVVRTDARYIAELFSAGEVAAFFVNYPDPWDKRRWKKNRILNEEMIASMSRMLKPDGFVRYKTDHREYFDTTVEIFKSTGWKTSKLSYDLLTSEWAVDNIPTEFEMLFKSQSKPLHLLETRPQQR